MIGIVDSRLLFRYAFPGRVRLESFAACEPATTARNYGREAILMPVSAQGGRKAR
jgi:hypothetical protein